MRERLGWTEKGCCSLFREGWIDVWVVGQRTNYGTCSLDGEIGNASCTLNCSIGVGCAQAVEHWTPCRATTKSLALHAHHRGKSFYEISSCLARAHHRRLRTSSIYPSPPRSWNHPKPPSPAGCWRESICWRSSEPGTKSFWWCSIPRSWDLIVEEVTLGASIGAPCHSCLDKVVSMVEESANPLPTTLFSCLSNLLSPMENV
jgi:hypothetical protein